MISYASPEQLAAWLGTDLPTNEAALLRAASLRVALACRRNIYDDAPPSDITTPLGDATCAQVAAWVAMGVDPAKGGTDLRGPVKRTQILTAELMYDTAAVTKLVEDAANGLCQEAIAILTAAGLLYFGDFEIADGGCLLGPFGEYEPR